MDPDEYETLTQLHDPSACVSPLQLIVDFNMLVREHGEEAAFGLVTKLRDLFE